MSDLGTKSNTDQYENQISEIIQGELIDLYGVDGYKSIMQTMTKICGKRENEIIRNYELFAELSEGVFGRMAESKILDPIKLKINKIGMDNIYQEEIVEKKSMKILIADDDRDILSLYKTFLESKDKEVTLTTDGHKCVEEYKRKYDPQELQNYFDVVVLDQKMPS